MINPERINEISEYISFTQFQTIIKVNRDP